jgi:cation:H+ antiporter
MLLEGVFLVLLLALVLVGIAAGPPLVVWGIGMWTAAIFGVYVLSVYLLHRYDRADTWRPVDLPDETQGGGQPQEPKQRSGDQLSTGQLFLRFGAGSLVLLAAGSAVAQVGSALAEQSGLGTSSVGATLVAVATSLPEVSTTIAAVRLGSCILAVSNIFGSNAVMVALLFLADVLYREGALLAAVDRAAALGAAVGIVVTAIYLLGLIERANRTVWRLGVDSAAVVVLYLGSLVVLYQLR